MRCKSNVAAKLRLPTVFFVVWCLSQEDDDRRFPLLSLATSTVVYDALCSALFAGVCLLIASRSMRARSNAVVC